MARAPGYKRDPDGRVGCMRFGPDGRRRGWCGTMHRYEDRARTHARTLNRTWTVPADRWVVVPLTVAMGLRP